MKPLSTKYARRRFHAARDADGVPHVEADSWLSAIYALGYLHAIDRPTQMLFARAMASGRAAELISGTPELVETDRLFRRVGLYQHLDREVSRLEDDTFRQITAYCEGVNDGMKQAGRSLPMWATGFQPEPWNQQAVLLVGNLLNYGGLVVSQQQNERLIVELVQSGVNLNMLRELFEPYLDDADLESLKDIRIANRLSDEALELITDLPRLAGSNAWAIAPHRTAGGGALLASDPHLEVNRLPAIWYEAVLRWPERHVMGATLPGCPLFAVARTPKLAWGVTYFKADTTDYFVEDCRLANDRWQYRRGDDWIDFSVREETIVAKGGGSHTLPVYYNPQGTLENDPKPDAQGKHLLFAWTGQSEGVGQSMTTWLRLIECDTSAQGMDTVRDCPQPTLCWIFADTAGHIGRQVNGWVPIRPDHINGLLPIPAWDAANHWQGWLPSTDLPSEYDPRRGYVASANENPSAPGDRRIVTQPLPSYRRRRIGERLDEMTAATIEDMQDLQYDVISLQARELLEVLLPHLPEGEIKERLAAWDYNYAPESLEATLFTRLYRNVLLEIFGRETRQHGGLGWRRMLYLCTRAGFSMMIVTCIDRMLHKEKSLWWEDIGKGELIRRAADKLVGVPDQAWAVTNAFRFTNRFIETKFVGRALGFHTSELPMRGCHATPFQGHLLRAAKRETTFAPSYHFITDLNTDTAWTNLPGGPSESWLSRWYKVDVPRWLDGTYKELRPEAVPE